MIPEWVPDEMRDHASLDGQTVVLNAPHLGTDVHFPHVPTEWTIELQGLGVRRPQTVRASRADRGVLWRILSAGPHEITLGARLRTIEVVPAGPARTVSLVITTRENRIRLSPGKYSINAHDDRGDELYFRAELNGAKSEQIRLDGNARVHEITGVGTIRLDGDRKIEAVNVDGVVTVSGTLMSRSLSVTSLLEAARLEAEEITAAEVVVRPPNGARRRHSPSPLLFAVNLAADRIDVSGPVRGTGENRCSIRVRESFNAGALEHADITAEPVAIDQEVALEVSGALRNVAASGRIETVKATSASGRIRISGVQNVDIKGNVIGDFDINAAKSFECHSLEGYGTLVAPIIVVDNARGGDCALHLVATDRIAIADTVTGVELQCAGAGGSIQIGPRVTAGDHFRHPNVDGKEIHPGVAPRLRTGVDKERVIACSIINDGDTEIIGSVSCTHIQTAGDLRIAGSVNLDDLSLPVTWDQATDDRDALSASGSPAVVHASAIVIGKDVSLGAHHRIVTDRSFHAAAVSGGHLECGAADGVMSLDNVAGATVSSAAVAVAAGAKAARIAARLLTVGGAVDEECEFKIEGTASFGSAMLGQLDWLPHTPDDQCILQDGADKINVDSTALSSVASDTAPPSILIGDSGIRHLLIAADSRTTLRRWDERPGKQVGNRPAIVQEFELGPGARVSLEERSAELGTVMCTGSATVSHRGAVLALRLLSSSAAGRLTLRAQSTICLMPSAQEGFDLGNTPDLLIQAATIEVESTIRALTVRPRPETDAESGNREPALAIKTGGAVRSLRGEFRLASLNGRLDGAPESTWRERLPAWLTKHPPASQSSAPKLVGMTVSDDEAASFRAGHLVGIDVTALPFSDIPKLKHLHVFDPDGYSLMRHASGTSTDSNEVHRERAQRLKVLGGVVRDTATSGDTQSAVMWAVARAHHESVTRFGERAWRILHRMVGYGQRPLPALATWVCIVFGGAFLLHHIDSEPQCAEAGSGFIETPYGFWSHQLLRVAALPAGILRLEAGGAAAYAPVLCSAPAHLAAFVVTSLPLAYLIVALRNYLRTPADR